MIHLHFNISQLAGIVRNLLVAFLALVIVVPGIVTVKGPDVDTGERGFGE
jgi:hypothetical protein